MKLKLEAGCHFMRHALIGDLQSVSVIRMANSYQDSFTMNIRVGSSFQNNIYLGVSCQPMALIRSLWIPYIDTHIVATHVSPSSGLPSGWLRFRGLQWRGIVGQVIGMDIAVRFRERAWGDGGGDGGRLSSSERGERGSSVKSKADERGRSQWNVDRKRRRAPSSGTREGQPS
ncbi:hypothetical protein PM082_007275 [Marasmius tenuissimus]|nr:hypothetical protein PM082_007275 [Marasmius tenuissimus]